MNGEYLELISLNIWHIIATVANLLILAWIIKKFLFKPVVRVMNARQEQVDKIYSDANEDRAAAGEMKQEYEARLAAARDEADSLVRSAVQTAQRRSDAIMADAASQASHLKQKAEQEIAMEKSRCCRAYNPSFPIWRSALLPKWLSVR